MAQTTTNAASQLLKTPIGKLALILFDVPVPKRPADRPQPSQSPKGLVSDVNSNTNTNSSPSPNPDPGLDRSPDPSK